MKHAFYIFDAFYAVYTKNIEKIARRCTINVSWDGQLQKFKIFKLD